MITEEEARNIRCCGPEGCGKKLHSYRYCIASHCMAWRWGGLYTRATTGQETRKGFCGLAGKP